MRKFLTFLIAISLISGITGCDALQRKFTRKKKAVVKQPRIYQVKKYEKKPSPELYRKHYVYWMTWQSEMIKVLGQNHKKDIRCIEEAVGNLKDMQNVLLPEMAEKLQPHINRMSVVKDTILKEELSYANKDSVMHTLEREDRAIKREFAPGKVRNYLKKSFDDETSPGTASTGVQSK